MFNKRKRFILSSLLTHVFFLIRESKPKISPVHTENEENYDFPKTISAMRSAEVEK